MPVPGTDALRLEDEPSGVRFDPPDAAVARSAASVVVEARSIAGSRADEVLAPSLLPQFGSLSFGGGATLLQGDEWLRAFEQLRHELQAQSEERQAAMASGVAAVGSLSVGYVIWLVRGGVLMSSMLSALPAWQMVDPLPVLAASGAAARVRRAGAAGGDAADDDDEVERLFDDAPDSRPAPTPDRARAEAARVDPSARVETEEPVR